jgi:hypothetical protein
MGVIRGFDYFLSVEDGHIRVDSSGSNNLVDEDVGVSIENLIGLAHLRIVEDVIVVVSLGDAPVMTALH